MKNVTLSADEALIEAARRVAAARGTTLNEMIRQYLRETVGERDRGGAAAALRAIYATEAGNSGGRPFDRASLYEDRVR